MKDPLSSKECAERLKALADADRLRIVQALRSGPKNVSEITAELGQEIANVSHHLQILKRERIVVTEKQGRFVVYRLHPDVLAAARSSPWPTVPIRSSIAFSAAASRGSR